MSIVVITIPGEQKKEFVNMLHKKTGNGVTYVIVQRPKKPSPLKTLASIFKTVGIRGVPKELYYALLLRVNRSLREKLLYFLNRMPLDTSKRYLPKVIEVDSINEARVEEIMKQLKPKVLVVWGTAILSPKIFSYAKHAINLHMGLGEHYRGAVANHFAVLHDEKEKIGATIHYLHEKVDTGDVLFTLSADLTLPPKELFQDLNVRAERALLAISYSLWKGERPEAIPQNTGRSRNVLLREWVPSKRYNVAKKLAQWEETMRRSSLIALQLFPILTPVFTL